MILDRLLQLADPEYRDSLRNPGANLYEALTGGTKTVSGEQVSSRTALTVSGYYGAIRAISEDCAKVPLPVYRRLPAGGKERATNHALYPVLHDSPNPNMGSMSWRATMLQHAQGWGNGYSWIRFWDSGGRLRVRDLWPLDPTTVTPKLDTEGVLYYEYRPITGGEYILYPWEVFHLHGLGFDGLMGYSIAAMAKQALGLAMAQEKAGAAQFGAGMRPSGVIEHPTHFKTEEAHKKFRSDWQKTHSGAENFHKVVILQRGLKFTPTSIPAKDAEWIAGRVFSVQEAARWFRIPPHKLQELSHATYSNIAEQENAYVKESLLTWMTYFEQEIWRKLILGPDKHTYFAEHLIEGLLRGSAKERNEAFEIQRRNGVLNANEWREKENMNPIGEQGDIYTVPVNTTPLDKLGEEPEPVVSPAVSDDDEPQEEPLSREVVSLLVVEETRRQMSAAQLTGGQRMPKDLGPLVEAHRLAFNEAYGRLLRIERDRVGDAKRKADFAEWEARFYADHVQHVQAGLTPVIDAFCRSAWLLLVDGEYPERIANAVGEYTLEMVGRHVADSRREIECKGAIALDRPQINYELNALAVRMRELCNDHV